MKFIFLLSSTKAQKPTTIQSKNLKPVFSRNIQFGHGQVIIEMGKSVQCPDIVLCNRDDQNHAGFPTVASEIRYTQSQAALNYNSVCLLFGSGGKINAVVTVKVSLNENSSLGYLDIDVWRMTISEVDEDEISIGGIERDVILTKTNWPTLE